MASDWISYNDLAWTEDYLAPPEDYEREVGKLIEILRKNSLIKSRTLLHLACGAGGYDTFLKEHFQVTGVDLSKGMLEMARDRHPELEYLEGDMRSIRLNRKFDAVIIPDGIDYIKTEADLRRVFETCSLHLRPGGVLLIVAKTSETFQNNNFAYTGGKENVHVTLLENNFINSQKPNTYEATFVYLIRRSGEQTIHSESQILGLFPTKIWEESFGDFGFRLRQYDFDGLYDDNLISEGEYPMFIFAGQKTS